MGRSPIDPLPAGLALLALGAGVLTITFASLGAENVSYARTEWSGLLAMGIATPAILFYAAGWAPSSEWWRSFWTVAFLAYLLHFWWAVFRTFNGDFSAIIERQGWVAYTNFLATLLWGSDIAAAWVCARRESRIAEGFHLLAWLFVTASLLTSAIFGIGVTAYLGYSLAVALICILVLRFFPSRSSATIGNE